MASGDIHFGTMRILLIAHDFPPIPSPQSLRWAYLVRELAAIGHRVEVIAPAHPGYGPPGGLPSVPDEVRVHRTFPGPYAWMLGRFGRRTSSVDVRTAAAAREEVAKGGLTWKGWLMSRVGKAYSFGMFPDVRAEWTRWARRRLPTLLQQLSPDIVIASHEPANTLLLGLDASAAGYRLVADLGDPVCSGYTPRRWRRRAHGLEAAVCRRAELVMVTSLATGELLRRRHAIDPGRLHVLTQGYGAGPDPTAHPDVTFDPERLELLYSGRFYSFRNPESLVQAVLSARGVRLNIASDQVPESVREAATRHPQSIRLLGYRPHEQLLGLQRSADVLINLGNDDPVQVPGKLYEYLGAGRPILHITRHVQDEASDLVRRTGSGWVLDQSPPRIAELLSGLAIDRSRIESLSRNEAIIANHSWRAQAAGLARRLADLAGGVTTAGIGIPRGEDPHA